MDDIGADLIAAGRGQRYAVSVKARLFRPGSRESRVTVIETDHLRKLGVFADRFGMVPLLAQAVCLADDAAIHLFLFRARQLGDVLPAVKNGFSIRFGPGNLAALASHPAVDYSCWREEMVAGNWFGEAKVAAPNQPLQQIPPHDSLPGVHSSPVPPPLLSLVVRPQKEHPALSENSPFGTPSS